MYELITLTDSCHYFSMPSKIGLYTVGKDAYLIDSGNNKDAAKKILKTLDAMGLDLKAVLVTHSHADHIGGCAFLQERTGCRVLARGIERAFTQFPILEPTYVYGGFPPEALRHKFMLATPSDAEELSLDGIEIIDLPGHSFDMVGYKMPDGTVYLGDALSSPETLEKYSLGFMWDIKAQLETLVRLETLKGERFVLSHAEAPDGLTELIEVNRQAILKNCDMILSLCTELVSVEELLAEIFDALSLTMTFEQNALCMATLRSYLTYLENEGLITLVIDDNRLKVKKETV